MSVTNGSKNPPPDVRAIIDRESFSLETECVLRDWAVLAGGDVLIVVYDTERPGSTSSEVVRERRVAMTAGRSMSSTIAWTRIERATAA